MGPGPVKHWPKLGPAQRWPKPGPARHCPKPGPVPLRASLDRAKVALAQGLLGLGRLIKNNKNKT
ncbi:hypothetical protein AMTR_s00002p00261820 [Amborella trichopoda]|uniref:Uncharacterized protein n=1 Tax=Amborella trichopoda TaxID=13333 RepID=W1P0B6_AMBTC|nr:hypothetical protein AMTR_s00002p00261820 [Amborella trichopoda]